ncbi:uncharacterized protein LOC141602329 [Silene latifolia]|uniref:uncharacterized protein LOC141602329 n=1 Tax=Silene latifolia TaxID=37657 RepID=UPI003D76C8A4
MGNCQAVDAAALVVQHPNGKIERMYWPVKAHEVMKLNPGHYVALIIPLPGYESGLTGDQKTGRYTRIKLLRSTDTLVLGHAYRLLTSQEVKKILRAKKLAKAKMNEMGSDDKLKTSQEVEINRENVKLEKNDESWKLERRLNSGSTNSRSKTWRPSLKSISEAVN